MPQADKISALKSLRSQKTATKMNQYTQISCPCVFVLHRAQIRIREPLNIFSQNSILTSFINTCQHIPKYALFILPSERLESILLPRNQLAVIFLFIYNLAVESRGGTKHGRSVNKYNPFKTCVWTIDSTYIKIN